MRKNVFSGFELTIWLCKIVTIVIYALYALSFFFSSFSEKIFISRASSSRKIRRTVENLAVRWKESAHSVCFFQRICAFPTFPPNIKKKENESYTALRDRLGRSLRSQRLIRLLSFDFLSFSLFIYPYSFILHKIFRGRKGTNTQK